MTPATRIPVPVGQSPYEILIGTGLLAKAGETLAAVARPGPILIVTDGNVGPLYLDLVSEALEGVGFAPKAVVVEPGEGSKSLDTVRRLYDSLLGIGADRGTAVVALGGGMVTDLAGFAAATFLRGLPWMAIPTSVLAQVDASVGGKTAVNLEAGKNLVGCFHHPVAVLADLHTLTTLEPRHLRNGLAEAAKAAIGLDAALFEEMVRSAPLLLAGERQALGPVIADSVRAKARVVAQDEREAGLRRVLNLGHTAGHAIEAAAGYGPVLHGEAVAVGIATAARIAVARGLLERETADRMCALLESLELPVSIAGLALRPDPDRIRVHLTRDKKRKDGRLALVLPTGLGRVEVLEDGTEEEIMAAIPGP